MNNILKAQLKQLIEGWISKQPTRSIAALSRLSGVGESTIRRLKNDDILPSETNTIKILMAISNQKSILKAMTHYEQNAPEISEYLKSHFLILTESFFHKSTTVADSEEFLGDYNTYLVFKMASGHGGISRKHLIDLLGIRANSAIQKLLELSLISEDNGNLTTVATSFSTSLELAKNHAIKNIENFYKPNSVYNSFCNISDNVSIDGFGDVIEIMQKTRDTILEVMQQKPGNIPIMTVMVTDTMTANNVFERTN